MRHTRTALAFMVAVAWSLFSPPPAEACKCAAPGAPCSAFWQADTVFLGRVTSIETARQVRDPLNAVRVHFTVQHGYRGAGTGQIAVHTSSSDTSCGYPFRTGETYMVYANQSSSGALVTTLCSRTRRAAVGADDVAYAYYAASTPTGFRSRIAGRIRPWGWSGSEETERTFSGLRVTATSGEQQFSTVSGASGEYVLPDVPAGKYVVAAEAPPGYEPVVRQIDVRDPQGCGPADIVMKADGRVSGRVVDSRGVPVPGLPLDLVVEAERDLLGGSQKRVSGWTGPDGAFEFRLVPQGEYVLGFNTTRGNDGRLALPRAFYPGVVEANDAGTIKVAAGERVQLQDFVVPQAIRLTTVKGVVVDVDGRAIGGATVTLRDDSEAPNVIGREFKTTDDGYFSFAVVVGVRYDLHISRRVTPNGTAPRNHVTTKYFTAAAGLPIMTVVLKPSLP
jgi:hypothetical protein